MSQNTPVDVEEMLTEVGIDAATADPAVSVGETSILRSEQSVEMLPQHSPPAAEITLDTKIGEGQVTEVYLGTQKSMRRKVAVRRVNPVRRTASAPGYVLSEAWMVGAFEHPNVLPIYGVSKDADGLPLVAMKAIETVTWTEVLETPGHQLGCPPHADPMEFNVRRIISVCDALEHAHFRGMIHRDVKPGNILIGRDGTLYLHGWELAVALDNDASGRFPRAADQTQIAGTPAYMAPELASKSAAQLGPPTDVYLVGATLHEVVTGEARHLGENVFDAFYSAVASTPVDYDAAVPAELARILNKAMAADPRDRFQTMTELRHALEAFLRHRPSEHLVIAAQQAHQELLHAAESRVDIDRLRDMFITTVTIYGDAGRLWVRNPAVAEGVERAAREMIEIEFERGSAERVRALLGYLSHVEPELTRRIDEAAQRDTVSPVVGSQEVDTKAYTRKVGGPEPTFAELEREVRSRRNFMVVLVAIWSMFGFAFAFIEAVTDLVITNLLLGAVALVGWVALGVVAATHSRTMFTAATVRYVLGPIGAIVAGSAALVFALGTTATPHELVAAHLLVFFVAIALMTSWLDWRMSLSAGVYFIAYIAASAFPEGAFVLMGAANLIGLGYAGYVVDRRMLAGPS